VFIINNYEATKKENSVVSQVVTQETYLMDKSWLICLDLTVRGFFAVQTVNKKTIRERNLKEKSDQEIPINPKSSYHMKVRAPNFFFVCVFLLW